jgi:hypothetical protein
MNLREITRNEWKQFLDDLSERYGEWEIAVQVLNSEIGAQYLIECLPFVGLTLEEKPGKVSIELAAGTSAGQHQVHSILDPQKLLFETESEKDTGTLDIEDASGTKTLVSFIRPAQLPAAYPKGEMVTSA